MIENITILNSKERKHFLEILNKLYGIEELPNFTYFYIKEKERLYVVNKEIFNFDLNEIKTNSTGLYIGTFMLDGFRFSVEGSQIFSKLINKNILEITKEQRNAWIKGEDLETDEFEGEYVVLKCENDFLASAKVKNNIIKNFIPKARKQKKVFGEE
ncbi:MAG: hypothetical protein AB7V77_05685 [Candidatus Woesearchaeota archaeon]